VITYAWFALFTSLLCLLLAFLVYSYGRKSQSNKLFVCILLWSFFWSLVEFLRFTVSTPIEAAILSKALVLWPFYSAFLLHFALVYTESDFLKNKLAAYIGIYVPAAVFAGVDLTTSWITAPPVEMRGGYQFSAQLPVQPVGATVENIWSSAFAVAALVLCIVFYFRTVNRSKKTQTKFIILGLAFPVISSLFTNSIMQVLNIPFPSINSITTCLFSLIIAYAIWRYRLFQLNPAMAAENIIAAMPDPLILAGADGGIVRVNEAFVEGTGYTQEEVSGKQLGEMFLDRDSAERIFAEFGQTNEIKGYETVFVNKSGEKRDVLMSVSVVRDKNSEELGFACVIHDVTESKKMAAKLVISERFASIGQVAGMVGHDLRNPLSSISAATYYLKNHYSEKMDETGREMIAAIEKSVNYSKNMVEELLDYSREIKLEREATTPRRLIDNAFLMVNVPPQIRVVDECNDIPKLDLDVAKVSRVFVNLITNAIDAMPDGGTLTVKVKTTPQEVEFEIADTGVGIPAESMDKLWVPLFTTKSKGMGLGLPICKRIVEAHHGRIQVESEQGKGTTFKVTFPLKNGTIDKKAV
jgi:PAS domain S-box-containing protein